MLLRLRAISLCLLLVAMVMLLACRVLPHHHHTLHLSGALADVELMHFGADCCGSEDSHTHGQECECPGEKILYYTSPCDDLDAFKVRMVCDFSPMILPVSECLSLQAAARTPVPIYKIPKIPDKYVGVLSLRAPPAA